jgi:hypothetical protein
MSPSYQTDDNKRGCANDQSLLAANDDSPAKVDVAIAFHPSFLVEADLKNITSVPCAIFKGDQDDMLSEDQLDQVGPYIHFVSRDKLM